jgi:hypothetical protein
MVHVPEKQIIVVYGGNCLGFSLSDCWAFHYETNEWEEVVAILLLAKNQIG